MIVEIGEERIIFSRRKKHLRQHREKIQGQAMTEKVKTDEMWKINKKEQKKKNSLKHEHKVR